MKTKLFLLATLAFGLCPLALYPQGFSYQAVLRDAAGQVLASQQAGFRISLLQGNESGAAVYTETHQQTSTPQGIITFVIGKGSVVSGNFSQIDWAGGPYFLKVEADPQGGSAYSISEVKHLHWVPYAKLSERSESISAGKLEIKGDASQNDEEALFEVKRNDGQTVFAVYPDGVRIYVEDLPEKGSKGGFAVGGFDPSKGLTGEYLRVTPDSVRIYLDDAGGKGSKGGFAVGGFDPSKGITDEFMRVTGDSTRVYVKNQGKGSKGGFAVGGFDPSKGPAINFLDLTPENYFIGHQSGIKNTTGRFNSFLGFQSGPENTTGSDNALFGYQAGYKNTGGTGNLFLGYQSGYSNTNGNFNSFMGYKAGLQNTTGARNTFLGSFSGVNNTNGNNNVFLGFESGFSNIGGESNVFIGDQAGYSNDYGLYNVFIGHLAGYNSTYNFANVFIGYRSGHENTIGSSNVFIGESSGRKNSTGGSNVFIGDQAGESNTTGSNNIHIGTGAGQKGNGNDNLFMGFGSGFDNTSGTFNVFLGSMSGFNNRQGNNNVYLGTGAGYINLNGSGNVFIGREAGGQETGSNKLYIDNSNTSSPLIYGDFSSNALTVNGILATSNNLRISTNPGTGATPINFIYQGSSGSNAKEYAVAIYDPLWVQGPMWANNYYTNSDLRLKKELSPLEPVLSKLFNIGTYYYYWENKSAPDGEPSEDRRQIGMIAQEIEKTFPELVYTDANGFKSVDYSKFSVVLLEAVREQQALIDQLKSRLEKLESER